jgi:hypothetical protein
MSIWLTFRIARARSGEYRDADRSAVKETGRTGGLDNTEARCA